MDLTDALKAWLVKNADVEEDASDDEFKLAAGKALATGDLQMDEFTKLSTNVEEKEANEFVEGQKQTIALLKEVAILLKDGAGTGNGEGKPDEKKEGKPDEKKEGLPDWHEKLMKTLNPGSDGASGIRVKGAWEAYNSTKGGTLTYPASTDKGKPHVLAGRPVEHLGRQLSIPSQLDKALAGTWAKWQILSDMRGKSGRFGLDALSDHEKDLFYYMLENEEFDKSDDRKAMSGRLTPTEQKTLIDDATSGGLEAAPIVFDDQIIQVPLLHGELYPYVNVVPLSRGRRIEGVITGTVTGNWGGADSTAISLFNTNSYVSAFDTTIYRWQGAVRIGLDFLSDTPIDFGAHLTTQYGERMLEDLDDVIAAGNGTTQPEGVINKTSATSVTSSSATTIGNYESLRFGVAKPEHRGTIQSAMFCGTETSYQRMKAIPVGTTDARRLFGDNPFGTGGQDDYSMMGRKYAINEALTNLQIFYAIMSRYRMYRRKGLAIRTSTEGDSLIRGNEMLITAMGRFGGQMERAACVAVTTDAPA